MPGKTREIGPHALAYGRIIVGFMNRGLRDGEEGGVWEAKTLAHQLDVTDTVVRLWMRGASVPSGSNHNMMEKAFFGRLEGVGPSQRAEVLAFRIAHRRAKGEKRPPNQAQDEQAAAERHWVLYDEDISNGDGQPASMGLLKPLHFAILANNRRWVRQLLADPQVNVNEAVTHGQSAGAEGRSYDGITPLVAACLRGYLEYVVLLQARADIDVNLALHDGTTPLIAACRNGHWEVFSRLVDDDRVDVNKSTRDGTSPLIYAVIQTRDEFVRKLLSHDSINASHRDSGGFSALDYARVKEDELIIRLLQSHAIVHG